MKRNAIECTRRRRHSVENQSRYSSEEHQLEDYRSGRADVVRTKLLARATVPAADSHTPGLSGLSLTCACSTQQPPCFSITDGPFFTTFPYILPFSNTLHPPLLPSSPNFYLVWPLLLSPSVRALIYLASINQPEGGCSGYELTGGPGLPLRSRLLSSALPSLTHHAVLSTPSSTALKSSQDRSLPIEA